jgi:predicted HicB family RNase H-like nuclease
MSAMHYKGYSARIDYDGDDEIFHGHIVGISDVISFHGTTVDTLREAFHEAVDDYVATCKKIGKAPLKSYSGNLMLRIDPNIHANSVIAAELAGLSLSQWSERVLDIASKMDNVFLVERKGADPISVGRKAGVYRGSKKKAPYRRKSA